MLRARPPATKTAMDDHARDGYTRLTAIVPLAARQRALPEAWRAAHRAILAGWAVDGRPPTRRDLAGRPGVDDADALLARLAEDDMVVRDAAGEISGAYPFSRETTPHRVTLGAVAVHAMCAVDALAMAPMFDAATQIDSACAVTGRPLRITMQGLATATDDPGTLRVGIHWAPACGHTAHSLCRQMVFLADADAAASWQAEARDARRLYTLEQAVDLGAAFFVPLLA